MNQRDAVQQEHEDISPWLPWYLNRTLGAEQSQRVGDHVERCAQCRADTVLWHSVLEVAASNDVEFDRSEARLTRLMARIDADQAPAPQQSAPTAAFQLPWFAELRRFIHELLGAPRRPLSAAAAVAVAVLLGVLGAQTFGPSVDDAYEVRSDNTTTATGLFLRLELVAPLSEDAVQALLDNAGIEAAWQRDETGQVLVELPAGLPARDVLRLIDALKTQSGVAGVQTKIPEE